MMLTACDQRDEPPEAMDIRNVAEDEWPTPATIQWRQIRVLERGSDGWVLSYIEFDAQNEFGALYGNAFM